MIQTCISRQSVAISSKKRKSADADPAVSAIGMERPSHLKIWDRGENSIVYLFIMEYFWNDGEYRLISRRLGKEPDSRYFRL